MHTSVLLLVRRATPEACHVRGLALTCMLGTSSKTTLPKTAASYNIGRVCNKVGTLDRKKTSRVISFSRHKLLFSTRSYAY